MCIRKKSQLLRINACVIFNLSYPFKYIYIIYTYIFWMPNSYIFSQWCYGIFIFISIVQWGNKGSERLTYWPRVTQTVSDRGTGLDFRSSWEQTQCSLPCGLCPIAWSTLLLGAAQKSQRWAQNLAATESHHLILMTTSPTDRTKLNYYPIV